MPEKGELLTPKIIEIVGSSTAITGKGFRIIRARYRLADLDALHSGERDYLAEPTLEAMDARLSPSKAYSSLTRIFCDRPSRSPMATVSPTADLAGEDSTDGKASDVLVVINIGHQQLQRVVAHFLRRGNRLDDRIEQRAQGCVDSSLNFFFATPSRETA